MSRKTILPVALSALFLSVVLAACGGDDDEPTTTSSAPTTAVTTTSTPPTTTVDVPTVTSPQSGDTTHLTDVRLAHQPEGDRVTFEFKEGVPGYEIGYATMPPRQDGSGAEIPVKGNAGVAVRFTGASGVDLTGGLNQTYKGPDRVTASDATLITEVVKVSDFESTYVWAIGVNEKRQFTVTKLTNPSRVIVDFK